MRATKLTERIGTKVEAQFEIVHSVRLNEPPIIEELTVDYMTASTDEVFVGISRQRDLNPHIWSLAAVTNADFKNLGGFKTLAEDVVDGDTPVVTLRKAIIANAEEASLRMAQEVAKHRETVVHSVVRQLGS